VLLRCGILCSGKHDHGQLLFTSPSPSRYSIWKYPYSCVNRSLSTALPRLTRARKKFIDVKILNYTFICDPVNNNNQSLF
jgi:hypothetical protein